MSVVSRVSNDNQGNQIHFVRFISLCKLVHIWIMCNV